MSRWAAVAAAVIVAMSLGRLISDKIPLNDGDSRPFVRAGVVGKPVHLEYADVTVTGIRAAHGLDGGSTVLAGGVFLIVDVDIVATERPTRFAGIYLLDSQGRVHQPTYRGSTCSTATVAPTAATWHVMVCFDVAKKALQGSRVVLSRGAYGVNGSGQRRDDLARIDLGIDRAEADDLYASKLYYYAGTNEFEPLPLEPIKPPAEEAD